MYHIFFIQFSASGHFQHENIRSKFIFPIVCLLQLFMVFLVYELFNFYMIKLSFFPVLWWKQLKHDDLIISPIFQTVKWLQQHNLLNSLPITQWFAKSCFIYINLVYTDFNMLYIDLKILDQIHAIFYSYFPKAIKTNSLPFLLESKIKTSLCFRNCTKFLKDGEKIAFHWLIHTSICLLLKDVGTRSWSRHGGHL